MAQATCVVWLTNPEEAGTESAHYSVQPTHYDFKPQGWFKVVEIEVEFQEPMREDVIPAAVATLREQQQAIRAEGEKRINQIEAQISKLLSISYSGPIVEADDDIPF